MRSWAALCSLSLLALGACSSSSASKPAPLLASGSSAAPATRTLTDADAPVPVTAADPQWGSATALVTIVVFSDFQCPFCSRVEASLAKVREAYGPNKVRIVWKNDPLSFHQDARPAAEAAMGVFALGGNDAFWKMHERMFANQRDLGRESYLRWAAESGVDAARLQSGLEAGAWRPKVEADLLEAKAVGVEGTPASYINGVEVGGAQPFAYFQAIVDEELGKAEARLAAGVARTALYATQTRENWKSPEDERAAEAAAERPEPEDDKTAYRVPVGTSPTRGSARALVTLVVFSDYQCPFCKRFEPTLAQIEKTYGDKVRIVWKDQPLPFHVDAMRAAVFAREARAQKGEAGFWAAHDKLFAMSPGLEKADLERAAKELGLDVKKVQAAAKSKKFETQIAEDVDLAEDLHANGTPHTFVNGRRKSGAQPFERFKALIDEELGKAQAAVAQAGPTSEPYELLQRSAKGPDEPERRTMAAAPGAVPTLGPAKAKVTITVIGDFQCPFCARAEKTLDEVRKAYGTKVRVVARDLPLPMHPNAPLAAEAAREAFAQKGNDGYWKMRNALFEDQKELDRQHLEEHAKKIGLDLVKFRAALDGHVHAAAVDADASAARDAKITATPAFLVNDYFLSGAQPLPKFRRLVDRALADKPAAAKAP